MTKKLPLLTLLPIILAGCASVPLAKIEESNQAKQYNEPSADQAGIYIYRVKSALGSALKKDIWIDGECVGESASGVFFYEELPGDKEYKITTESEFSPNDLIVPIESGRLYFVEQYMKLGAFTHGANLQLVDEAEGKREVSKLEMAKKGKCS